MINNMSKIFNPLKLVLIIFFISQLSLPLIHGFQKNAKKNEFYPGDALDIVFIDIYKKADSRSIDISGQYVIDSRGYITMPAVGNVKVVGDNRYTLAEKIAETYKLYFTEPYIAIKPLIRVTLMGAFQKPGSYRISPESSLWELIEKAGGPQSNCDLNSIKVLRGGEIIIDDLLADFEKGYSLEDIQVNSGDQVVANIKRRFGVREVFDYLRFAMSIVSLYVLIVRYQ